MTQFKLKKNTVTLPFNCSLNWLSTCR